MRKYKVHTAYITFNGIVRPAGEYLESELDIAEARKKTFVTLVDATVNSEMVKPVDSIKVKTFGYQEDFSTINLEPVQATTKVIPMKINSVEKDEIVKLKYVGVKTADSVIKERPFVSYADMNERVPLKNKVWEDIAVLQFETLAKSDSFIKYE